MVVCLGENALDDRFRVSGKAAVIVVATMERGRYAWPGGFELPFVIQLVVGLDRLQWGGVHRWYRAYRRIKNLGETASDRLLIHGRVTEGFWTHAPKFPQRPLWADCFG